MVANTNIYLLTCQLGLFVSTFLESLEVTLSLIQGLLDPKNVGRHKILLCKLQTMMVFKHLIFKCAYASSSKPPNQVMSKMGSSSEGHFLD